MILSEYYFAPFCSTLTTPCLHVSIIIRISIEAVQHAISYYKDNLTVTDLLEVVLQQLVSALDQEESQL